MMQMVLVMGVCWCGQMEDGEEYENLVLYISIFVKLALKLRYLRIVELET